MLVCLHFTGSSLILKMSHSILLIQPSTPETRTYSDYESVNDCLEGVCRIYEEHLKRRNPNTVRCCHDDTLISYNRSFFMFTANNHLRYQPAIWLRRSTQGLERFGLSEINKHLCSLQQRLDQGKDLRFVAESSWNILSCDIDSANLLLNWKLFLI